MQPLRSLLLDLSTAGILTNIRPSYDCQPARSYIGIDFIVAWVVTTQAGRKKTKTALYVVFNQCTISLPEWHNILPSEYDTRVENCYGLL